MTVDKDRETVDDNDLIAAGGLFAVLLRIGLDPRIVTADGAATNAITIKPGHMKSRYQLTVKRIPNEDEIPARVVAAEQRARFPRTPQPVKPGRR